jgi:hypothetical protein
MVRVVVTKREMFRTTPHRLNRNPYHVDSVIDPKIKMSSGCLLAQRLCAYLRARRRSMKISQMVLPQSSRSTRQFRAAVLASFTLPLPHPRGDVEVSSSPATFKEQRTEGISHSEHAEMIGHPGRFQGSRTDLRTRRPSRGC